MRKVKDILKRCNVINVVGDEDRTIEAMTFDSRKAAGNMAFFALKGTQVDGHDYMPKAIEQGCSVVVCEKLPEDVKETVTYYVVDNSAKALGYAASEFYDRPSEKTGRCYRNKWKNDNSNIAVSLVLKCRLSMRLVVDYRKQNK